MTDRFIKDDHKRKIGTTTSLLADESSPDDESPDSIEEAILSLPKKLKKWKDELALREAHLQEAEIALAKNQKETFGDNTPDDVLVLNISGTKGAVSRRTLCQIDNSLLASQFSGRWDDSLVKDKEGNFFINQPFDIFKPFLNYLQSMLNMTPDGPPLETPYFKSRLMRNDFIRMVEYYGCTLGVFPVEIILRRGLRDDVTIHPYPNIRVHCSRWSTFTLESKGHNREIKSFSVVTTDIDRALIGWVNSYFEDDFNGSRLDGVGEGCHSIALDCSRNGLLIKGAFHQATLPIAPGSVVKCDRMENTWSVDGTVVISPKNNKFLEKKHDFSIPAFSGRGQWHVVDIGYFYPPRAGNSWTD